MPLRVSSELRFPKGEATPIGNDAVDEFVTLARRVANGGKSELETFKKYFCRSTGEPYYSSSSTSWAESDLERDAMDAAKDGPGFLGAFFDACEVLERSSVAVPDERRMNDILIKHNEPFRIVNGELNCSTGSVEYPEAPPGAVEVVARALRDAKHLGSEAGATSAIDRIHTALHAYLLDVCRNADIEVEPNMTATRAFKLLRSQHPALKPEGPRSEEITRILQSLATVIDALSTLRNRASLAHDNLLLEEPEAVTFINAANTVFMYIQDCINRESSR